MGRTTIATAVFGKPGLKGNKNPLQESEPVVKKESDFNLDTIQKDAVGKSSSLLIHNDGKDEFVKLRVGGKGPEDQSAKHSHLSINTSHLQDPRGEDREGSI